MYLTTKEMLELAAKVTGHKITTQRFNNYTTMGLARMPVRAARTPRHGMHHIVETCVLLSCLRNYGRTTKHYQNFRGWWWNKGFYWVEQHRADNPCLVVDQQRAVALPAKTVFSRLPSKSPLIAIINLDAICTQVEAYLDGCEAWNKRTEGFHAERVRNLRQVDDKALSLENGAGIRARLGSPL